MKPPKTFTCHTCGKVFTKHDEGYRHWVKCSQKLQKSNLTKEDR